MSANERENLILLEDRFRLKFDGLPETVRAKHVGSAEDCDGIVAREILDDGKAIWYRFERKVGASRMGHGNMEVDSSNFFRNTFSLVETRCVLVSDGFNILSEDKWGGKEVIWLSNRPVR